MFVFFSGIVLKLFVGDLGSNKLLSYGPLLKLMCDFCRCNLLFNLIYLFGGVWDVYKQRGGEKIKEYNDIV